MAIKSSNPIENLGKTAKPNLKINRKNENSKSNIVIVDKPIIDDTQEETSKRNITSIKKFGSEQTQKVPNLDYNKKSVKNKRSLHLNLNSLKTNDETMDIEENIDIQDVENTEFISQPEASKEKKDVSINQNSAFFSEPSIFKKFNISVLRPDENTELLLEEAPVEETSNEAEYDFVSYEENTAFTNSNDTNDINSSVEETQNPIPEENEEDVIDVSNEEFEEILNELSDDNLVETDDSSNELSTIQLEAIPEDLSDEMLEKSIIEENYETNLEDLPQTADALNIIPKIEEKATPNFFESSIPSITENTNNIIKKAKSSNKGSSIFKKFTFDEASSMVTDIETEDETNIIPTQFNNISNSIPAQNILQTNLSVPEFKEEASVLSVPTVDTIPSILKNTNTDSENIAIYNTIITPEKNSDIDTLTDEELNKEIEKYLENQELLNKNLEDDDENTSTSFESLEEDQEENIDLDNENIINIKDENNSNEENDEDFSLEDYFHLEDTNYNDISEEEIEDEKSKILLPVAEDFETNNNEVEKLEFEDIEENLSDIENILKDKFSTENFPISDNVKQELLSELELEDLTTPSPAANTSPVTYEEATSDFSKIIDSLTKTITDLENSTDTSSLARYPIEETEKSINILINEDDIFSISILNETYEIVADFDGISVLSENLHISTPKNNFFVQVGEKYIEIHNNKDHFLVYTNFEDIEFANAINNVTFAKKNNKIELNIKEAFKISSINKKIELSMLNTAIANLSNTTDESKDDNSSICDNKTLLISEETQKVYLPYSIEEVMQKLNSSLEYQTIDEVVEKEYTLPLAIFKRPIIARFREAYKFMREKEHSSVYAALDLAVELMFNSELNPAIIRASKDLKELNIYLDCLYENELDKFDCFKIVYKVLPKIQ